MKCPCNACKFSFYVVDQPSIRYKAKPTIGFSSTYTMLLLTRLKAPLRSAPVSDGVRCPCGGIGRRDRFKICCPQGRACSSQARGTKRNKNSNAVRAMN